jgi:hypothetical protein
MEKKDVFQNECSTMVYYPELKIVHNTFRGQPAGKHFRDALDAGVETMKKYGSTKWLSDDRENKSVFSAEDQDWADNDWFPRMLEIGWKTWAMVVPNELRARLNVKEIIEKIFARGIRVMVFTNLDDALEWLKKS